MKLLLTILTACVFLLSCNREEEQVQQVQTSPGNSNSNNLGNQFYSLEGIRINLTQHADSGYANPVTLNDTLLFISGSQLEWNGITYNYWAVTNSTYNTSYFIIFNSPYGQQLIQSTQNLNANVFGNNYPVLFTTSPGDVEHIFWGHSF
jgi:hypothetical protein